MTGLQEHTMSCAIPCPESNRHSSLTTVVDLQVSGPTNPQTHKCRLLTQWRHLLSNITHVLSSACVLHHTATSPQLKFSHLAGPCALRPTNPGMHNWWSISIWLIGSATRLILSCGEVGVRHRTQDESSTWVRLDNRCLH
jgi:hypothetical protein